LQICTAPRCLQKLPVAYISVEMAKLLDQQKRLLNADGPLTEAEPEEMRRYTERNKRLRDLCRN